MRLVSSSDGVRVAVYESGPPEAPAVVAVHGYPDSHTVWDGLVAELSDRYRVITYDVRGAGESDKPASRAAYRLDRLADDLRAVLDVVSPDAPVHLVAHDWGSIQSWASVSDPGMSHRIASFTSISGPSLDHAGAWLRALPKHAGAGLRQLLDSYYIALFQMPALPEAAWRSGLLDKLLGHGESRTEADKINGLQLYRANGGHLARPRPTRTSVPVQVIAPERDRYVTVRLQTEAPVPYLDDLTISRVAGGHWVIARRPDVIARLVGAHIQRVTTGDRRRESPVREGRFANQLVVITGAGSGIGRACALEFARAGADVVVADIDDAAAKTTVEQVQGLGVDAWAFHLDVTDAEAWQAFADRVRDHIRPADVIVNNAGIGMSGAFLDTTAADWQRIVDINLWGVIHGSRVFGAQLVERGQGGHIVNVASAAAWGPSRILSAYGTTKAAVLYLTESLRPEFARHGIGVTAISPGFVDTNISRSTVHVGVDETEQAALREHAVKAYGRRGYTPERVARRVVRAIARNKPVQPITAESYFFRAASRYAPALNRRLGAIDLNRI